MNKKTFIEINNKKIGIENGKRFPTYIIAEMSANHNQNIQQAIHLIEKAKEIGADAIKLQTYTPDTMTIESNKSYFHIKGGLWDNRYLYELYGEAYTPWEWLPELQAVAQRLSIDLFSTPFDSTAVDFLEKHNVPAYKIASFEVVDIPLLKKIAQTGKPVIMSTGMSSLSEIEEAVTTLRQNGCTELALLKCTSSYPALPEDMNLRTIPHLAEAFQVVPGLSDHTMGTAVPIAGVALGACIIEKHFTMSRSIPGPDSAFSLEPQEFKTLIENVRVAEKALGEVSYVLKENELKSTVFRRSLFVVEDINPGEVLTSKNIRSIRPANGLHTRFLPELLGRVALKKLNRGEPLHWSDVGEKKN